MPFTIAEALRRAMQAKKVRMMTTISKLGNYNGSCTLDDDHDAHGILALDLVILSQVNEETVRGGCARSSSFPHHISLWCVSQFVISCKDSNVPKEPI